MAVEKEQEGHVEEWREGMEGEMRQLYYNLKKKNNKKKKKKMICADVGSDSSSSS